MCFLLFEMCFSFREKQALIVSVFTKIDKKNKKNHQKKFILNFQPERKT